MFRFGRIALPTRPEIKTTKGRTIMLQHNVSTPRPYDRINLSQGTKGIFRDYPSRVFIDGQEGEHNWQNTDKFKGKNEHQLWSKVGPMAGSVGGHGGMDYIMCYRLFANVCGLVPYQTWMFMTRQHGAPGPLSEMSVAKGSNPVKFPDFTRGRWMEERRSLP